MLWKAKFAVCSEHRKKINTQIACDHVVQFVNVKPCGT
jgi:hypothetical protein